eukprot:TRINITY_DN1190_c2_g1_i1.p1 TRINITY_DN1190_c2_g1~~TRINITY_DN1190_c2_g1_i1.p1  ORF type:complete len:410 (-),score=47.69 TRINITY_DN1190_c2_g1_i1:449-1678(-)
MCNFACNRGYFNSLLSYSSVKFVKVLYWQLGLVYWSLFIGIILYVVIFQIVIGKTYQEYEQAVGTVSTKVKGTALLGDAVYDIYDLVYPSTEHDALFIITNLLRTDVQTRGTCDGIDSKKESCPHGDSDCVAGTFTFNGVKTGVCSAKKMCVLQTWCPLENDTSANFRLVQNADAFSITVKANVDFPMFDSSYTNVGTSWIEGANIFTLKQIVERAGWAFDSVRSYGTVILLNFNYDCDLNTGDECTPTLDFSRIDDARPGLISSGFNFRFPHNSVGTTQTETRTLFKAAGVRIIFNVSGRAGKFSYVALIIAIGAGFGLLGIATLICDFILAYFMPDTKENKYETVNLADHDAKSPAGSPGPSLSAPADDVKMVSNNALNLFIQTNGGEPSSTSSTEMSSMSPPIVSS